jgi:hypothetical protein
MASTVVPVDTPQGPGRFFLDLADRPSSILVLGHGAGGGVGSADLELLALSLPELGTSVLRFEQPWRTAGRKVGAPPPRSERRRSGGVSYGLTDRSCRDCVFGVSAAPSGPAREDPTG